jgi:hypothetical protein
MELKKRNEKEVIERVFFCPTGTPSSKNSRQWTGRRFLPSKATTLWRSETEQWWIDNKVLFEKELVGLEKPYLIGIHFVRKSKHKFDFVNPVQTIQDEMTKHGYILDDNCDEMMPFPLSINGKWFSYDKNNPGAYIKVFKNKNEIDAMIELAKINPQKIIPHDDNRNISAS